MPGFHHYVALIPEPYCYCRPAVAGVCKLRFCWRFVTKRRNWMETTFRNDERQAKTFHTVQYRHRGRERPAGSRHSCAVTSGLQTAP